MKKKLPGILNAVSVICLALGIIAYIVALFFEYKLSNLASTIVYFVATILEFLSLILLIVKHSVFGFKPVNDIEQKQTEEEVKTVDVKPVEETPAQSLYKQYEELYKEGYITKEDLEKKKEELLR